MLICIGLFNFFFTQKGTELHNRLMVFSLIASVINPLNAKFNENLSSYTR